MTQQPAEIVALTRRQAREIERETGVRPVAVATTPGEQLATVAQLAPQQDTGRIERNVVTELIPVLPEGIVDDFNSEVSHTVRAAKPATLIAKQRRRAAVSMAAAASVAAVAGAAMVVPTADQSVPNAGAADLNAGIDAASESTDVNVEAASAPSVRTVVTSIVPAPDTVSDRVLDDSTGASVEDAPEVASESVTTGTVSTGTSTEASIASASTGSEEQAAAADVAPRVAASSVLETARSFIGTPYVLGGASPSGWDCSGFTQYVYGLHGVYLPHSASAQGGYGTVVSDPQPGDLVVWYDGSHIAIYAGNGMIVDAGHEAVGTSERALWTSSVYYVRL